MKTRFEIKFINLQGAFSLLAIIIQRFVSLIFNIEIKSVVQKKWKKPAPGLTGTQVIF